MLLAHDTRNSWVVPPQEYQVKSMFSIASYLSKCCFVGRFPRSFGVIPRTTPKRKGDEEKGVWNGQKIDK